MYVLTGPLSLFRLAGVTTSEIETAAKLMNSYPKGSELILVDAVSDGKNARHLVMLLQWHFKIFVKTSVDFAGGERDQLLKSWLTSVSHVHFVSLNSETIEWLDELDSKISFD